MKTTHEERKKIAERYANLTAGQKLVFMYGTAHDQPVQWPDEPKKEKKDEPNPR